MASKVSSVAPPSSSAVAPSVASQLANPRACEVWREWGRLTRFLESARLAFARERKLWTSLEIAAADDIKLTPPGAGKHRFPLAEHLAALGENDTLYGSVLIHSYALAESAAAHRLSADARDFRGIEDWGGRLLDATDESWGSVKDGLAGAVEVAVARNAYAHGARCIDHLSARRLQAAGATQVMEGDPVTLTYETLRVHRGRLRNLLGVGGIGDKHA